MSGPTRSAGKKGSEEYLDSEKYQIRAWDRDDPISIAPLLTQLNQIRRANPALQRNDRLTFHKTEHEQILCYSKQSADGANTILVAINLDPKAEHSTWMQLDMAGLGLPFDASCDVEDLLTGARYTWKQWCYVALKPEQPAHILRVVESSLAP